MLHIGDGSHRSALIGLHTDGKTVLILFRESGAKIIDIWSDTFEGSKLIVNLYLSVGRDLQVYHRTLLLHFLHLSTGRHLITDLQLIIAHMGDNHKEEEHCEDKIRHRCEIQPRNRV